MNILDGVIVSLSSSSALSSVCVESFGEMFEVLTIDTPQSNPMLDVGKEVTLAFKESDVVLSPVKIPFSSCMFEGVVTKVQRGEILLSVTIQRGEKEIQALLSSQTSSWVKEGEGVYGYISPHNIFFLKGHDGE